MPPPLYTVSTFSYNNASVQSTQYAVFFLGVYTRIVESKIEVLLA